MIKNLPAIQETRVQSLGLEDSLEEEMATHSSIPAWEIPQTEKPGGLQSVESQSLTRMSDFHFTSMIKWIIILFYFTQNSVSKIQFGNSVQRLNYLPLERKLPRYGRLGIGLTDDKMCVDISGLGLGGSIKHRSPVGETEIDEHFLQKW